MIYSTSHVLYIIVSIYSFNIGKLEATLNVGIYLMSLCNIPNPEILKYRQEQLSDRVHTKEVYHTCNMAEPSRFDKYVAELSHGPASFPSSEESRHIAEDIIRISMGLVAALSKKWRMFKDAKLIRAGSMQDELKIGAPDEYDFMIELPACEKIRKRGKTTAHIFR